MEWEQRLEKARAGLAPLRGLCGDWEGTGTAHGAPITSALRVRERLDMIEAHEQTGDHEDICFYRFDPEQGQLRVLHLMAGATIEEHPIEPTDSGFVWVTPPLSPAVDWSRTADGWRCEVVWPGRRRPEVVVVYRRLITRSTAP